MFIKEYKIGKENIYLVEDDKFQILHFFKKEIENIKFRIPCKIYIKIDINDRQFYRTKLQDLIKKISKLSKFECHFLLEDEFQQAKQKIKE